MTNNSNPKADQSTAVYCIPASGHADQPLRAPHHGSAPITSIASPESSKHERSQSSLPANHLPVIEILADAHEADGGIPAGEIQLRHTVHILIGHLTMQTHDPDFLEVHGR